MHSSYSLTERATLFSHLPILFFLKSLIATLSHVSVIPTRLQLCNCKQISVFFFQAACIFQDLILHQSLKAKQNFNLWIGRLSWCNFHEEKQSSSYICLRENWKDIAQCLYILMVSCVHFSNQGGLVVPWLLQQAACSLL